MSASRHQTPQMERQTLEHGDPQWYKRPRDQEKPTDRAGSDGATDRDEDSDRGSRN